MVSSFISFSINVITFLFSSFACRTKVETFHRMFFYGSVMSEFLRISRCTLLYSDFLPSAIALFKRMINQGGSEVNILNQISKAIRRHSIPFKKYGKNAREITRDISSGQIVGVTCEANRAHSRIRTGRQALFSIYKSLSILMYLMLSHPISSFRISIYNVCWNLSTLLCDLVSGNTYKQFFKIVTFPYKNKIKNYSKKYGLRSFRRPPSFLSFLLPKRWYSVSILHFQSFVLLTFLSFRHVIDFDFHLRCY